MKFVPPFKGYITCVLVGIGALISSSVVSQSLSEKKRAIVLSVPVLFNATTVYNVLGPQRDISGTGISNGISISYEQSVSKLLYIKVGTGLFTQRFTLKRPFFDFTPPDLGMATKKYIYNCYEFVVGGGLQKKNNR